MPEPTFASRLLRRVVAVSTSRGVMSWGLPMAILMPVAFVLIGAQELPTSSFEWATRFVWSFLGYGLVGGHAYEAIMRLAGAWEEEG